ncbi:MAG TPA: hypothetical protein VI457_00725 [Methylococcaceae bacterium]|nr:hypothetical protein [Methylococcaceae bacterium]
MARSGGWPVLLWRLSDVMPSRMGIQGDGKMTQTSKGVAAEIRLGAVPTQINKPSFNETKATLADRRKIDAPLRGNRMLRLPFVVGMGLLHGNRSREQTARVRHRRL